MSGQPDDFDFGKVIPTESPATGTLQPPTIIIKAGNTLKLKSYFHCGGTPFVRAGVTGALVGAPVVYFFDDLEAGGPPVRVAGGAVSTPLTDNDKKFAFGVNPGAGPNPNVGAKDLQNSGLDPNDEYWLSIDTIPITTGLGNMLNIPAARTTGTWRVLTQITGTGAFQVAAFDDNLIVHVSP